MTNITKSTCILLSCAFLFACKKNKIQPPVVAPPVVELTRQEKSLDSIFLYAKQIYYWNDRLPSYEIFDPRKYNTESSDLLNYSKELLNITKYSNPYEWATGETSSKYSYISDKTNKNPSAYIPTKASVDLDDNGNDFGIRFGLYGSYSNYFVYVTAVYPNSPADKQGFQRGDVVQKINGTAYGSNYNAEVSPLNNALSGTNITLEGVRRDGVTSFNISLNKEVFKSSPIYKIKVFDAGVKKIGYLAFARFSYTSDLYDKLTSVFNDFATAGVTDLIVDLRYNGGGYVSTAEHLINLITPSTTNGVMFAEHYNAMMQNGNATILKNQPLLDIQGKIRYGSNGQMLTYADLRFDIASQTTYFNKKGNLSNVKNIVFIVSGSTASASELVINSLKPSMNVKLVGKTTYGKPIGFFPITIENRYDVYFSMFETKNSQGQGGYYAGMTPDVVDDEVPAGTVMYSFGDARDNYTKKALDILASGSVIANPTSYKVEKGNLTLKMPSNTQMLPSDFLNNDFVGMIENRLKIK